ncbi:MAG: hypothetical protein HXX16_02285 [Bacteroidales bacterium]|nr:hypothetical protein [Bacteroidales bacterium]
MNNRCYHIINICFASIILGILFYSLIFRGDNHPIPALFTKLTGIIPPSKGLSASFSELVRGNFESALILNPYSIRIFSFFIIQLFTRAFISLAVAGSWMKTSKIILIDAFYSTTLFVFCFAPLISYTLSLFAKLL